MTRKRMFAGTVAATLLAGLWWRFAPEWNVQQHVVDPVQKTDVRANPKRMTPDVPPCIVPKAQEKPQSTPLMATEVKPTVSEDRQEDDFLKRQVVLTTEAAKTAPASTRYPNKKALAYRESRLTPKTKGGKETILREWLVRSGDEPSSYVYHVEEEFSEEDNGQLELVDSRLYVANQIIVKLDGETSVDAFEKNLSEHGASVHSVLMTVDKDAKLVSVRTPVVDFESAEKLVALAGKISVCSEPSLDFVSSTDATTPNDPQYSQQWGLSKISAPAAWDIQNDASSVVVALLDTGVRYDHEDLAGNMWINPQQGTFSGVTGDRYGMRCIDGIKSGDPMDDHGHGSHCAGIIGAVANNGKGVAGVCWKAKIMALKAGKYNSTDGRSYFSDSDVMTCLSYARAKGAKVVNCSFGGTGNCSSAYTSAFLAMRTSGIIVVCAAGNGGSDQIADNNDSLPHYPSSFDFDNIIAVTATTSSDALTTFSNYGRTSVDIAAPGLSILSTYNESTANYRTAGGTSMAAPFVSGAAALVWAKYPSASYATIISRILQGGDALSTLSGKVSSGSRLNLVKALQNGTLTAPSPSATRGTYADKVVVSWSAVSGATHYKVWRAATSTGTKTELSGWQTATSYSDTTGTPGTGYYYFVQAATSSSGANVSPYSSGVYGYRSQTQTYPDAWDPGDNTISGATSLSIGGALGSHGSHGLNEADLYDYFKFNLTSGRGYVFESTGDYDLYGEIFNDSGTQLAYNDDGGSNRNFKITFTPSSTANYYLRVRKYDTSLGGTATYMLKYQSMYPDSWDPTDDTAAGATSLTPTTSTQTTASHGLNAYDSYDFYKVYMTAGRTYRFESTGSYDMYGELFSSQTASSSYRVSYDDDSGDGANFKIVYTPATSGYFYLRVRRWTVGLYGAYQLKYSMTVPETHDLVFYRHSEWDSEAFLTNDKDGNAAMTEFTTADTITAKYAYYDAQDNDINVVITNLVAVFDADSNTLLYSNLIEHVGLSAGYYWRSWGTQFDASELGPGSYVAKFWLNFDERVPETDYDNNVELISFTVSNPQSSKTLSSISVIAPSTMTAGTSTNLACMATYSDGSTERVTAVTWNVVEGSDYAELNGSTLCALEVDSVHTVRLSASYTFSGVTKTATHSLTVSPAREEPYGQPVQYPNPAMIVMARVRLDGELAPAGTVLYAFVGSEVRGRAELTSGGMQSINVSVAQGGESITFKAWDPVNDKIYSCNEPLSAVIGGSEGTPTAPYEIQCFFSDPFGVVQQHPNPPMTVVAHVSIFEAEAASGDMVGVFSGDELRGKGAVTMINGKAVVSLTVYVKLAGEQLTFRVWDASEETLHNARGYIVSSAGGSVGSPTTPYEVTVASTATQVVTLGSSGWQFVSINVLPDDNSPGAVFADATGRIDRVSCGSEVYSPSWPQPYNTLSAVVPGKAYWVKVKDSVTKAVTFSVEGAPADTTTTQISLASGWNAVGYVPQQPGETRSVLSNFLDANKIVRVTGDNSSFDPTWPDAYNSLTVMRPGVGYWVNAAEACSETFVEPSGSSSSSVAAALQAMNFESPWNSNDLDMDPTTATTIIGEVKLFGSKASYGDAIVAVFADGSSKPCAVQEVNVLGGVALSFCKYPGVHLTVKVWDAYTGVQYDADTEFDLTVNTVGEIIESDIVVSGQAPTYKVVFDLRGATGGSGVRIGGGALTQRVARCSSAIAPEVRGNVGYEFVTWDSSSFGAVKCDLVVHACYDIVEVESVSVSFDSQGGTACPAREYYVGYPFGELPAPVRDGYLFDGWYTTPSGDGAKVGSESVVGSETTTLYARWRSCVTALTFDANGGTGGAAHATATFGLAMPAVSEMPVRSGHSFAGYFDAAAGGVQYYTAALGSARNWDKLDASATLFAHWELTGYQIAYANVKDGAVNPNPTTYTAEDEIVFVPLDDSAVVGWAFAGWSPTGIKAGTESNVTVTARWTKRKYPVSVGGQTVEDEFGSEVTLTAPFVNVTNGWTNVVCTGWIGTGDVPARGSGSEVTFVVTRASTLEWLYQTNYWFEVSVVGPGAVAVSETGYAAEAAGGWVPAGTNVAIAATGDMEMFQGWRDLLTGEIVSEAAILTVSTDAPHSLSAEFAVRSVTRLSFDANGGTGAGASVMVTNGLALPAVAVTPVRTGYVFAGYFDARSGGIRYYDADLRGERKWTREDAAATLYAQWTAISYSIAFDANGGEGTMDALAMTYGVSATLPACTFSNGNMKFRGWGWSADGGVALSDRESVSNLAASDGATARLYAVWDDVPDGFAFEKSAVSADKGAALVLVVEGGSDAAAVSVTLEVAYANASAGDLLLKRATVAGADGIEQTGIKFPQVLNWAKGDTEPKTITIPTAVGKVTDAPKYLTWNLSSAVGMPLDSPTCCLGEIVAGANYAGNDVCVLPFVADTVGGKVSRGMLTKAGKTATLKATANKGYWFAGWYDESGEYASADASFKVATDGSEPLKVYEARFVEAKDSLCGTYVGYARVNLRGMTLVKGANTAHDIYGDYAFTATLSTAGKVSGAVTVGGKKVAFKGDGCFSADDLSVSFLVPVQERAWFGASNVETLLLTFGSDTVTLEGLSRDGEYAPFGDVAAQGLAYRDMSKDADAEQLCDAFTGLYAGSVDCGDGRIVPVSINVGAKGKVKIAGKFWDGTAISASGVLGGIAYLPDEERWTADMELVVTPKALGCGSFHLSVSASSASATPLALNGVVTAYTKTEFDSDDGTVGTAYPYVDGCWVPEVGENADLCGVTLTFEGESLTIPCAVKNGVVTGLGKPAEPGVTVNFSPKTGMLSVTKAKVWTVQGVLGDCDSDCSAVGYRSADGTYAPAKVSVGVWDLPDENLPWTVAEFSITAGETVGDELQPEVIALDGTSLALTISGLPSGLKFDKQTGKISGAAKKAGSYAVKVSYTYLARKVTRSTTLVVVP